MNKALFLVAIFAVLATACGDDDTAGDNNNNNSNNNNSASPDCGDGVLDPGEQCDDGSANSDALPDACRTDCRDAYCGDGIIDSTESCDNGTDNSDSDPDACRSTCEPAHCGDGTQDSAEVCDDGNTQSGDGCSADCLSNESCGNGLLDTGEQCDCGLDPVALPQGCDTTNDHINSYCITGCQNLCIQSYDFNGANSGHGFAVAVDASGNFAVTGHFTGIINLGGSDLGANTLVSRAFVAKFDPDGNHRWSIELYDTLAPSGGFFQGRGVAFDSQGDLYAMGIFDPMLTLNTSSGTQYMSSLADFGTYVLKLDGLNGEVLAYTQLGGSDPPQYNPVGSRIGSGITVDHNDNVIVVGEYTGIWACIMVPCFETPTKKTFVVKLDAALVHDWTRRTSNNGDDVAVAVAVDSAGDVFYTGQFEDTLYFDGGWSLTSGTGTEKFAFLAKLSGSNGNTLWSKMLGTYNISGEHAGTGITTLSTGDVVVTGTFTGSLSLSLTQNEISALNFNAFMVAYAGDGSYLWHQSAGNNWAWSIGVSHDANDDLTFVGAFDDSIDLGGETYTTQATQATFLTRYDAQGNHLGSRTFGLTDIVVGVAVATTPGRIIMSGYTAGDYDFGCGMYSHSAALEVPFLTLLNAF